MCICKEEPPPVSPISGGGPCSCSPGAPPVHRSSPPRHPFPGVRATKMKVGMYAGRTYSLEDGGWGEGSTTYSHHLLSLQTGLDHHQRTSSSTCIPHQIQEFLFLHPSLSHHEKKKIKTSPFQRRTKDETAFCQLSLAFLSPTLLRRPRTLSLETYR